MKITMLLLLTGFVFSTGAYCQRGWQTGIKGGISIPQLRAPSGDNSSYSSGFQTVVGPQAGLVGEFRFNALFSIQAEFNYSTQGGDKKGEQRIRTSDFGAYIPSGVNLPDYLYADFANKISLVYLELPVMAKFSRQLSKAYRLSLYGGPYLGYLIKATGEASGKDRIYTDPARSKEFTFNGFALGVVDFNRKEDIQDRLNKLNYGLQGATSIEYTADKFNYFLALGGSYGFNRLQKDPNFGDNKTGGLNISIGITHPL